MCYTHIVFSSIIMWNNVEHKETKICPCTYLSTETYRGVSGGVAPDIINFGIRGKWIVDFTHWSLYFMDGRPQMMIEEGRISAPFLNPTLICWSSSPCPAHCTEWAVCITQKAFINKSSLTLNVSKYETPMEYVSSILKSKIKSCISFFFNFESDIFLYKKIWCSIIISIYRARVGAYSWFQLYSVESLTSFSRSYK